MRFPESLVNTKAIIIATTKSRDDSVANKISRVRLPSLLSGSLSSLVVVELLKSSFVMFGVSVEIFAMPELYADSDANFSIETLLKAILPVVKLL